MYMYSKDSKPMRVSRNLFNRTPMQAYARDTLYYIDNSGQRDYRHSLGRL